MPFEKARSPSTDVTVTTLGTNLKKEFVLLKGAQSLHCRYGVYARNKS